jgi:hypothetical protein
LAASEELDKFKTSIRTMVEDAKTKDSQIGSFIRTELKEITPTGTISADTYVDFLIGKHSQTSVVRFEGE